MYVKRARKTVDALEPALTSPVATAALPDYRNDEGRFELKGQGSYEGA